MADKRKAGRPRTVNWFDIIRTKATGLSVAEVARQFGITEGTVRNVLRQSALLAEPPKGEAQDETTR